MFSTIQVLVSFKIYKRKLTLEAGSKLESLEKEFMESFNDVLPSGAVSSDYVFQRFDPHFQEYVDLNEDDEIYDGDKFKVQSEETFNPVVPHKLDDDATYHIWSQVSRNNDSLMMRNNTDIKCNGSRGNHEDFLNITAKDVSGSDETLFRLELADPNHSSKCYVITGKQENKGVYVQHVDKSSTPPKNSESKFEPSYFFSFTRFRCSNVNGRNDLFLASDKNGKCTLMQGGQLQYPNPATLFICHKVT